jgi:hypothetical protein
MKIGLSLAVILTTASLFLFWESNGLSKNKTNKGDADKKSHRPLILSNNALGSLKLSKGVKVSKAILAKTFPKFIVHRSKGQQDGPDFHYFEIKSGKNVLFEIKSNIAPDRKSVITDTDEVPLDELVIRSNTIADEYGIKIGDRYSKLTQKRKGKLAFGASHHQLFLGNNKIFYLLETPPDPRFPQADRSPEGVTLIEVQKFNSRVTTISWPGPIYYHLLVFSKMFDDFVGNHYWGNNCDSANKNAGC